MTQDRAKTASDLIRQIMARGYDDRRILVGPDPEDDEIDGRIDVDHMMETRLDSMCYCISEDMGHPQKRRLSQEDCNEILSSFMEHVERAGEVLLEREDGVVFYAVPSPEDPAWVIAQVAAERDECGVLRFAGAYHHTSLLVLPEFTGRGIGSDLVVEHALHNGGMLNWDLDSCAYSPGGEAAHLSALGKLEDLAKGLDDPSPN